MLFGNWSAGAPVDAAATLGRSSKDTKEESSIRSLTMAHRQGSVLASLRQPSARSLRYSLAAVAGIALGTLSGNPVWRWRGLDPCSSASHHSRWHGLPAVARRHFVTVSRRRSL